MRTVMFCGENDWGLSDEDKFNHTLCISKKADRLSARSQSLCIKHQEAVDALFEELEKHNPTKDLQKIETDEFSWFTGQNHS